MMVLSNSPRLRFLTGATLYFAQGIPKGLLNVAMPAWLASQGLGAGAIASYLAIIILPWVFKLFWGPIMDRFQFPAMGLRRPWILGAQFGMSVALCGLVWVEDPMQQLGLMTALATLIQAFASIQDVATDGMAIDLVPEEEHGRINGFMTFGKAIGWASAAAVSGVFLTQVGLGTTALLAAAVSLLVFFWFLFVTEREGERRLPWSDGEHADDVSTPPTVKFLLGALNQVLWSRTSVIVTLVLFFFGLMSGYGDALMPIAAIKLFGMTTEEWSNLVAVMGLAGAFIAVCLGPLIDRFGIKKTSLLSVVLIFAHALLLALTEHLWVNEDYVLVMLAVWVLLDPVTMVCAIAIGMSICTKRISATQFAVYMSAANLGASLGSKLFGVVSDHLSYSDSYLLLSLLVFFILVVVALYRKPVPELPEPV